MFTSIKEIKNVKEEVELNTLKLNVFDELETELSERSWHEKREVLVDELNESLERFNNLTLKVFFRNKCLKVQKSINRYRKSVGMNTFYVDAII